MDCICTECGHIFDDGEACVIREDPFDGDCPGGYQEVVVESLCPLCHGYYEIAEHCENCGGAFLKEEMKDGLCAECLEQSIDYGSFLLMADAKPYKADMPNILVEFVFAKFFGLEVNDSSPRLRDYCRDIYLRQAVRERRKGGTQLLDDIRDFVYERQYLNEMSETLQEIRTARR